MNFDPKTFRADQIEKMTRAARADQIEKITRAAMPDKATFESVERFVKQLKAEKEEQKHLQYTQVDLLERIEAVSKQLVGTVEAIAERERSLQEEWQRRQEQQRQADQRLIRTITWRAGLVSAIVSGIVSGVLAFLATWWAVLQQAHR
ncbi:MAG: hypothetical protein ACYC7E_07585 [Armatimonadota bacterium]